MNKLLIACMSTAFALSVNAADWFNGGLSSATKSGGDWAEGTTIAENGTIALSAESGEVSFEATDSKSFDNDVVTITSTVALTEYDEVPEAVAGTKAALAPVDGKYYGLVNGAFVELTGATPTEDAVTVTIQMRKVLGQTQVKYTVGENVLTTVGENAPADGWLDTANTEAPTQVAYSGTGKVSSLAATTDTPEYLTGTTIATADQLATLPKTVKDFEGLAGKTITLDVEADGEGNKIIDMSEKPWPGIGSYLVKGGSADAFKGTFDGNGVTIANLKMASGANNEYRGFFNQLEGATVRNLTVQTTGFAEGTTGSYGMAAIAGHAYLSTIENCTAEGEISGTHNVGGIVVRAQGSTIKNCTNNADVSGNYSKLAGICVLTQNEIDGQTSLIEGCVNTGTITATAKSTASGAKDPGCDGVGGIVAYVGTANVTTLKDCTNAGYLEKDESVTTTPKFGQIVGNVAASVNAVEGTNVAIADAAVTGNKAVDGLNFAIANLDGEGEPDGTATLVKDADLVKDGSVAYNVMTAGNTIALAATESVKLIETVAEATVTAPEGYKVVSSTDAETDITTYTAVEAAVGFTITIAENTSATIKIGEAEAVDAATVSKIPEGADYVVTYSPADGYMFAAGTETQVSGTADEDVELEGPTALAIVATVDGTTYASMDDAIDAAIAAGKPLIPAEGQTVVAPNGFVAQVDSETGAITFVAKVAEAVADGYVYTGFLPTDAARAVKIFDGSLETLKTMNFAAKMCGDYIEHGNPVYADAVLVYDDDTLQVQYLDGTLLKVTQVKLVEKADGVYAYAIGYGYFSNKTTADIGTVFKGSNWNKPASSPSDSNANVSVLAVAPAPVAVISCSFDGEVAVSTKTVSFATINDSGKFAGCYDADNTAASTANRPWSSRSDKLFGQKALWSILTTAKLGSTTTDAPIWSMGENAGIALMQNGESVKLVSWKRGDAASTVVLAQGNVKGGKTAYNTFVVVTDETAQADKYKLYIDGDLVAASGEQETVDYAINCYQFGDTYGGSVFGKNTDAWLDEFETFTYPLSAAEVEAASVKFSDKVDNSVLVWNGTNDTVIVNATTAENPLGNPAAIGGATELVFNTDATVALANDLVCKNLTVNNCQLTLKKGSTDNVINDQTITLNGANAKLYFSSFGENPLNVSGKVILNGGTITGYGWTGMHNTLTIETLVDSTVFSSGNPFGGSGKIIKQGEGELLINAVVTRWGADEQYHDIVIEGGTVRLRANADHILNTVTGAGTLVVDGGSVTVNDPTDVVTVTPTAAAIAAGKVIKTEELEGGAVKYTVADAVQFTKAETITVGDMNGYYKSGKTEADEGCYAVVGQLASAETEFSLTVGETVVNDTDTISVSIGNNVMMTTKYFTVAEDGTLSVANVILAVEDVKVTVGGTDYVLATTPSGTLTVDSVVSNGSVNKVTAESDGSFKIVAKTTHEYISINFADQAGTTAYITKKTYNWPGCQPSSTYGITPPESDKGELALYPCGWADPDVVADYWEGATLEYMAYAVGKGSALVTLKYTKKDVEPIDPTKPTEEYASPEAAQAAADAINADKATLIAKPFEAMTDERKAAYDAVVTATVVGNKIVVDFSEDAKTEIQQVANVAVADADILDTAATTATVDVVPGFYYAIVGGTDVNAITTVGEAVLATGDTVTLTKPDLGATTKAFYKVKMSVRAPEAE